jgi:hypothetical protein
MGLCSMDKVMTPDKTEKLSTGFSPEGVQEVDADRYFASRFASAALRAKLLPALALFHEFHIARQSSKEAMIVAIRLAWWRERMEEIGAGGGGRGHPVLEAYLAAETAPAQLTAHWQGVIDWHERAINSEQERAELAVLEWQLLWALAEADALASRQQQAAEALLALYTQAREVGPQTDLRDVYLSQRRLLGKLDQTQWPLLAHLCLIPLYAHYPSPPEWRKKWRLVVCAARGVV